MKFPSIVSFLAAFLFIALPVSAHVVVSPKVVPGESYQTFLMGVPSERESSTIEVRLVVPENALNVKPNVKPGWTIELKKEMVGETEVVREIVWKGGIIPAGFRDEFAFSAKTPVEGELMWKAYQTYADGKMVAWDTAPAPGHSHESVLGPYSVTKVEKVVHGHAGHDGPINAMAFFFPLLAIGLTLGNMIEEKKRDKK